MSDTSAAIKLLQACVDEADDSYFRILVDSKTIKYLVIATGLFTVDDMCFEPTLLSLLPAFPDGDWNYGHIAKDTQTGLPHFATLSTQRLPGVTSLWHDTRIEYIKLNIGKKLRSGVYEATCAEFPGVFVAKFACFEWEIDAFDHETEAYSWIEGTSIGPKFYGHILEDGRTIGFMIELIQPFQHAQLSDIDKCVAALADLHQHGIVHGDVNRHNILITDGRARLIDFECARKTRDGLDFQKEMDALSLNLTQNLEAGGSFVVAG